MKIRTDFVTNSSSSSYCVSKIATFTLTDKNGARKDISFRKKDFIITGDYECSIGEIAVSELFNDFLVDHYINTQKIANVSVLFNGLLGGKKTPLVKEFIKSLGMEDVSKQWMYFSVEKSELEDGEGCHLADEWLIASQHLAKDECWDDSAEFIKLWDVEHDYNFLVFSSERMDDYHRFEIGYNGDSDYIFGEMKQHFVSKYSSCGGTPEYLTSKFKSEISAKCKLSKEIMESIENGEIKLLFFAMGTGLCDEIVWYSGNLEKENIRIHIFARGEKVTSIDDNTDEINSLITKQLNPGYKMVKPIDKRKIMSKVRKEKQSKVADAISEDAFDQQCSNELEKSGKTRLVTVLFKDKKKYNYFCEFSVHEGDQVYVEGKRKDEIGIVVEISDKLPTGAAASYTLNVTKAFSESK